MIPLRATEVAFSASLKRNLAKRFRSLTLLFALPCAIAAHDVFITGATFYRDVQPILNRRCAGCHAVNATLPLTTYAQVRAQVLSIRQQVLSRRMPPWGAVKSFGHFEPEDALSLDEIGTITGWIMGGAHEGAPAAASQADDSPAGRRTSAESGSRLLVQTRTTLQRKMQIIDIRPIAQQPVASARITAEMPDGSIVPLLWLFQYEARAGRTFHLLHPLVLPPGTKVASSSALTFELGATYSKPGQ